MNGRADGLTLGQTVDGWVSIVFNIGKAVITGTGTS